MTTDLKRWLCADLRNAKIVFQELFYLRLTEVRIAIGVQQALLCCQHRPTEQLSSLKLMRYAS